MEKLVNDVLVIACSECGAAIKDKDYNWKKHIDWHEGLRNQLNTHRHSSPMDLIGPRR